MAEGTIKKFTATRKPTNTAKTSSVIGKLFLTKMLSNPNYKTTITLPNNMGVVTGFCDGPFGFQGKADWKPLLDLDSYTEQFNQIAAALQATASSADVDPALLNQINFKSVRATESRWSGSDSPVFNLKFIMPSYDSSARRAPMDSMALLMACVYPSFKSEVSMQAPLGYGIQAGKTSVEDRPINTVWVKRGKFFSAPNQVMRSVSCSFSQEVMEDGYPLYIEANIEFVPWRMPDYKTVMSYFIGNENFNPGTN